MRTIRTIAILGVVLIVVQLVALWITLRLAPLSVRELLPALLVIAVQLLTFWRLWHLRHWAGFGVAVVGILLALYSLIWLPMSLPFLAALVYMLWLLPRHWRHLKTGF